MLLLHNADVRTMVANAPRPTGVAVAGGRIVAVGNEADLRAVAGSAYDDFDCGGALILPGFEDAHLHLLAYAASLSAVDCSPRAVPDIPELIAAIGARASRALSGAWIRAVGYRETELRERRHPTRWELDAAAPDNPVRLIHGSGHGCVLNSRALALVGIATDTEEPPGALIGRRLSDGEPDGLLLELNDLIERRIPAEPWESLRASVREANRRLLAAGVTTAHDLGIRNDAGTLAVFERLREAGDLTLRLVPALGFDAFAAGELPGWRGIVKLAINELDGTLRPTLPELAARLRAVAAAGASAAVHAVSAAAVAHAATAFAATARAARPAAPHRVEHAAICPPAIAARLAAAGIAAVYNPGLLYADAARFAREVPADDQPWLHNPAVGAGAGLLVAFGSDVPISPPNPLGSIVAAASRRGADGASLPGPELSLERALWAQTAGGAAVAGAAGRRGAIAPGMPADLVLLPPGWPQGGEAAPLKTMRAGRFVEP